MGSHFCTDVFLPSPATRSRRTTCGGACIFGAYPVKLMFTELRVIQAFVDLVVDSASKGDKVSWPGFGSFSTSKRQARTGRNPRTGEPVQIAASTAMKFSPSSTLKAALNPNR
jgi:nucleoid DNA-binding protein